ncbi:MAG: hypothetical protein ACKVZ0_13740 [Gemmatimonadales bacterium]
MGTEGIQPTEVAPRHGWALALAVYLAAALSLCWPMFTGQFLAGPSSDQFIAGYSFRHFAAEYFRAYGSIPLWNPFLFGGLPFVGAAHGDIFYPTTMLRWILPTDVAMNLGFALHIVLAGFAMYGLLRTLRLSFGGALVGGLTYQMTGIVLSLVHPGHDGKLFVSMLAPVLFMGIVRAVRDRDFAGYGIMALATGLSLQGHPQASQYLLVAAALWGAFWTFGSEGPRGRDRIQVIALATVAMAIGIGLYAVYALPMLEYVPFSPRGDGGYNTGWEHATSYALPANELLGVLLPKIDGGIGSYFGANGLKLHTEYLGPVALVLAIAGVGGSDRKVARWGLATVGVVFLLVSLGGATPFFRLWYEIVPMAKRLRAPGMAFFLVAMALAFYASLGAERLLRGLGSTKRVLVAGGAILALGLLAMVGALQFLSEDIARTPGYEGFLELAIANRPTLESDGLRLVAITGIGLAVLFAVLRGRLAGWAGIAALLLVGAADSWLVTRSYFVFSPGARTSFATDPIIARMKEAPMPYRVFTPDGPLRQLNPYNGGRLMADGVPIIFGYHGNELTDYDELLGGKGRWANQVNLNLWKALGVRFAVLNQAQDLPGFHQVLGPVEVGQGRTGFLYEADTVPPYARVVRGAAKLPEAQLASTAADARFPVDRLAVLPDTSSLTPEPLANQLPEPSMLVASIADWRPGRIAVTIAGASEKPEYLIVAENWYPDWTATVDGVAVTVHRAQNTLLSVAVPPGAKNVVFAFQSAAYRRGRLISLASLAGVALLFAVPLIRRKGPGHG